MKLSYIFGLLLFTLIFTSCKKDKLEGDKSVLIGSWEWAYTVHTYDLCNPPSQFEILSPQTENKSVTINFYSNGKMSFNDGKEGRIVFSRWESTGQIEPKREYKFTIRINNKQDDYISGWVGADTITLGGHNAKEPFEGFNCDGCCRYVNTFLKQ